LWAISGLAYLLFWPRAVLAILTYFSTLRWLRAGRDQTNCDADGLVAGDKRPGWVLVIG
jgi:hypothetical protein